MNMKSRKTSFTSHRKQQGGRRAAPKKRLHTTHCTASQVQDSEAAKQEAHTAKAAGREAATSSSDKAIY